MHYPRSWQSITFKQPVETVPRHIPNAILPHFVSFVWQYHQSLSLFVPPAPLPREGIRSGLDVYGFPPMVTPKPRFSGGTLRVSQVPGESSLTSALIKDPGRATLTTVNSARWYCPRQPEHEGHNDAFFEADSHGFSNCCLRFQIRISLHWQDSLPVG